MVKKSFIIIMFIVICIFSTSCGYVDNLSEEIDNLKEGFSEKDEIEGKEDEKYESYIVLNNFIIAELKESLDYYFGWFGFSENMKVDEKSNLFKGVFMNFDKEQIELSLKWHSKKPFLNGVDDNVKNLHAKLEKIIDLLDQVDTYFKLKGYVDDDFAKGKELHREIYLQYNEFKPLAEKFVNNFNKVLHEKRIKDLKYFKEQNSMIRYYALSCIIKAEELKDTFYKRGINSSNMHNLDMEEFKERYGFLVKDINKFLEYSEDEDRIKGEGLEDNSMDLDVLRSRIIDMKAATTDILVRAKQEKDIDNEQKTYKIHESSNRGTLKYYDEKIRDVVKYYVLIK